MAPKIKAAVVEQFGKPLMLRQCERHESETLAFAAAGAVKADIELQPLFAINQVFDRLEKGDVASRVVLKLAQI